MLFFDKRREKIIFFYSICIFLTIHTSDVFNPFRPTHKVRIQKMNGKALLLTASDDPNCWAMISRHPDSTFSYNASPCLVAKRDLFCTFAEKREQAYNELFEQLTPRQKKIHGELFLNNS